MTAKVIDGKVIAAGLRDKVAAEVTRLKRDHDVTPGLAVVLVGNDPASESYVRSKHRQSVAAGMVSFEHKLPGDVAEKELLALIAKLNADPAVHGLLVQLPLPKGLSAERAIMAIDPAKDVDGLHPINAGRLASGFMGLAPATPVGSIILSKTVHASLEGMNAIVMGRSNLVGRPLLQLLLNENATVTIAHSRTRDLAKLCRQADLVYAAVGRAEMVKGDWIKPGATVIDIGFNRFPGEGANGKDRIVGDVAYQEALQVAGAITPVPGGVGLMTVACLLLNTLRATCAIHGLPAPKI